MAYFTSPGVKIREVDLTNIVPGVSSSQAAFVGEFQWGPVDEAMLVDSRSTLTRIFGKPLKSSERNSIGFLTAASFLAYGNRLQVVRAADTDAKNAIAGSSTGELVKNDAHYDSLSVSDYASGSVFVARYPGELGNSLKISVCGDADAFKKSYTATYTSSATTLNIEGIADVAIVGSIVVAPDGTEQKITAVTNAAQAADDTVTFATAFAAGNAGSAQNWIIKWEYADDFGAAPGTSTFASNNAASKDELHIAIVDEDGAFTGLSGTILEKFAFVSKLSTAKSETNESIYYKDVLNLSSAYIRFVDHPLNTWGATANPYADVKPYTYSFVDGTVGGDCPLASYQTAFDIFKSKESYEISFVICPPLYSTGVNEVLAQYIIDEICEYRGDCVAFISPRKTDVVGVSNPLTKVVDFRNDLSRNSSYAFVDCNWKKMYDNYNDVYLWVPLSGDIAGLAARTSEVRDPWWSPAGYNRGNILNIVKLAWNPNEADRDILYPIGINPVVTFPNIGTILYGDKTLLSKPSAFDRVNVRFLFILLEKAISKAAKYFLFEFNDDSTRNMFKAMVEPFLRDVKGRRGITDFLVVCDETNNTGSVIDRNEFVGDIYIRPAKSISYIQLNFVAVGSSVSFSEVVGTF